MKLSKTEIDYINFVKGMNKYEPEWEKVSLMLALATEVDELWQALPSGKNVKSVRISSTIEKIVIETGDVIWTCIAIGNAGIYKLNNDLIFGHLDIGYCLSYQACLEKVYPNPSNTLNVPMKSYPVKLVDIVNKLHFKNFYTKSGVYETALYEAVLDICVIVGAVLSLYSTTSYRLSVKDSIKKNTKKLISQIGKER